MNNLPSPVPPETQGWRRIAQRGEHVVLLAPDNRTAKILNTRNATLGPETFVESILARGYWTPIEGQPPADAGQEPMPDTQGPPAGG
jgi:predicted RNA binding protein YcfA (HicA-like mRNA interferase family)